jgi:glycosyltransferase involved in cell wall biosynthesis
MSYLAKPFHYGISSVFHENMSNYAMSVEMAKAFVRLGYVVDIVDWQDHDFIPQRSYEVFLGMTHNFDRLLRHLPQSAKKIYWATRPERKFEEYAIRARLDQLYMRRRVRLPIPKQLATFLESENCGKSDAIIALGNPTIIATFRACSVPVYSMDNLALPLPDPKLSTKDFYAARRNFLYLSSAFFIRKGLDIVLDAFSNLSRQDLHLWVCAPLDSELEFIKEYRRELFHDGRIHPIGWVGMHSSEFMTLCNRCAFLLFPTCAEGMAGSVLNCMSKGIVPLVTPECGVEIEQSGIEIEDCRPEALAKLISQVAEWPAEKCRLYSERARQLANSRYTLSNFSDKFEKILRQALEIQ